MASLVDMMKHPDEFVAVLKTIAVMKRDAKQIPQEKPHLAFCYKVLHQISRRFLLMTLHLPTELRDMICILYLALRALDTIEDDTNTPIDVRVAILAAFHQHIHDPDWHFPCGKKKGHKALMDNFHHVSRAFLELPRDQQEIIEQTTMKMGAGMGKFICHEVATLEDYDEYCHIAAGIIVQTVAKLLHAVGLEDLPPDTLSSSVGLFFQKLDIIQDYLEDLNDSRKFWPRAIWSKYVDNLEDLKYKKNSAKALQCLNEMVSNALLHVEDCLKFISSVRDPGILQIYTNCHIAAMKTIALCYNNIEVFRGVVNMRPGLLAKYMQKNKSMRDFYGTFFDLCSSLKDKVDKNDPSSAITLSSLEAVLKLCIDFGTLSKSFRNSNTVGKPKKKSVMKRLRLSCVH